MKLTYYFKMSSRKIGCFTDEQLREFAGQPNVTVMQPTHDIVYVPLSASIVDDCVDKLIAITKSAENESEIRKQVKKDAHLLNFTEKYTTFYNKLTDREFVDDSDHVDTIRELIRLHGKVERGEVTSQNAQALCSDIALAKLIKRVKATSQP